MKEDDFTEGSLHVVQGSASAQKHQVLPAGTGTNSHSQDGVSRNSLRPNGGVPNMVVTGTRVSVPPVTVVPRMTAPRWRGEMLSCPSRFTVIIDCRWVAACFICICFGLLIGLVLGFWAAQSQGDDCQPRFPRLQYLVDLFWALIWVPNFEAPRTATWVWEREAKVAEVVVEKGTKVISEKVRDAAVKVGESVVGGMVVGVTTLI